MRRRRFETCLIAFLFVCAASAQSSGVEPAQSGLGEYDPGALDEISDAQRAEIEALLRQSGASLERRGLLPRGAAPPVRFGWPLLQVGATDYGYHGTSPFVDHDSRYMFILDYQCGQRSYDLPTGYNHKGTDIFLWPFAWNKMDAEEVHVVAAAPGVIFAKFDGNFDRNCAFNSQLWNAVYLQHADGTMSWYGHLKKGTVTGKDAGDTVAEGEYLGAVGSSGSSTAPHLHFEVHAPNGDLLDPFAGDCNQWNAESLWRTQPPYYDSAINHLAVGPAPPILSPCPNPDKPNESDFVSRGSTVYFTTYYRDQLGTLTAEHAIYDANGQLYSSWMHMSPVPHYVASYWYFQFNDFAAGAPTGTWRYQVIFNGETYHRDFALLAGDADTPTPTSTRTPTDTRIPTASATPRPTRTKTPTRASSPTRTSTPTRTVATGPTPTPHPGDTSCDARLSAADLVELYRLIGGVVAPTCNTADVDRNGVVDERDLAALVAALF